MRRGRKLGAQALPGVTDQKHELQERREVIPSDTTSININWLITL